jgi:metal-dependent amidase/aminoacylase/carboxypeptidase family protein
VKTARTAPATQFDYIREYYGIAIEKGMHVTDKKGRRGVIVGASNHVKVKIEGENGHAYFHPHALNYPALGVTAREDG